MLDSNDIDFINDEMDEIINSSVKPAVEALSIVAKSFSHIKTNGDFTRLVLNMAAVLISVRYEEAKLFEGISNLPQKTKREISKIHLDLVQSLAEILLETGISNMIYKQMKEHEKKGEKEK